MPSHNGQTKKRSNRGASTLAFAATFSLWSCALGIAHGAEPAPAPTTASPAAPASLRERVDQLIEANQVVPLAPLAADAEWLRRISLDLIGRIPSTAEARQFLDDPAPNKREAAVDRLLASPEHARHMATVFDVTLMERRPEKYVSVAEWQKFLLDSFLVNKPYDQLAREILAADSVDPAKRPASRFLLDREAEGNVLARDVGRMFFGMDLQCAQCHDHPSISDYYQADFQGLYAFFNRALLFTEKPEKDKDGKDKKPLTYLAEKADGDVAYQSVFDASRKGTALPKIPFGQSIAEPSYPKGQEYTVAPAKDVRPVPKYSRLAQLSGAVTSGDNPAFRRAIVNRLWAQLMGRGLVEPVDLHNDGNPPTHPAVLALLAAEFPVMKFDIRAMLRELALSRTYARSLDLPPEIDQRGAELAAQLATLTAARDQAEAAKQKSQAAATEALAVVTKARMAATPVADELAKAQGAVAAAKKSLEASTAIVAAAQASLPGKQDAARLVAEASARTQETAQKLAGDKALVDAAAKIKVRADQLTKEVADLQKSLTDNQAIVKTATDELAAQQPLVGPFEAKYAPLQKELAAAVEVSKAADVRLRADASAALDAAERLAEAQAVVAVHNASASVATARDGAANAAAELAAARAAVTAFDSEMTAANQSLVTAQQTMSSATQAMEVTLQQQAEKKSVLEAVTDALAKTEIAVQKAPESAELKQAATALKTKVDQLTAEAKTFATQIAEREAAMKAAADAMQASQQAVEDATAKLATLNTAAQTCEQAATTAEQQISVAMTGVDQARQTVAERASVRAAAATLKPLTPEQLAWSMMQAAGVVDRERAAVMAEWEKNHPTPDATATAAKSRDVEIALNQKLKGNVAPFIATFAGAPGQPQQVFAATADQALFLANGGLVRGWLAPAAGNLVDRLVKLEDANAFATELYLSVMSRKPTDVETKEVGDYMSPRKADRAAAVAELAWALFCSSEFRFNH